MTPYRFLGHFMTDSGQILSLSRQILLVIGHFGTLFGQRYQPFFEYFGAPSGQHVMLVPFHWLFAGIASAQTYFRLAKQKGAALYAPPLLLYCFCRCFFNLFTLIINIRYDNFNYSVRWNRNNNSDKTSNVSSCKN